MSIRRSFAFSAGILIGLGASSMAVGASEPFLNLRITSLTGGETVSGIVQLVASADDAGVASLQFQVDGRAIGPVITGGQCVVAWDTRADADGSHSVGMFARDDRGSTMFTPEVSVNVKNNEPRRITPR